MTNVAPALLSSARNGFRSGFARNASQSAHPHFWNRLVGAWCPSVGIQGRRLEDFSGRGNHGLFSTNMNLDAWVPGPQGFVLRYDGTDDWITLGVGLLNLNTDFTISAWVCIDDITHNAYSVIGNSVGSDQTKSYSMLLHRDDRNGWTWQSDTGPGGAVFTTSPTIDATALKWHHVVFTRNQSFGTFGLLQDGRLVVGDNTNPNFSNPVDGTWGLGCYDAINGVLLMKGWIGDVFLWNRNMLVREMSQLYEGAHPLIPSSDMSVYFTRMFSLATVTTDAPSGVTLSTATSGGNVTSDGNDPVTARGVCWSLSADPTVADSHTTDGTGTGTFVSSITGLSNNMTYHVRAYATNSRGTSYGSDTSFETVVAGGNSSRLLLLGDLM